MTGLRLPRRRAAVVIAFFLAFLAIDGLNLILSEAWISVDEGPHPTALSQSSARHARPAGTDTGHAATVPTAVGLGSLVVLCVVALPPRPRPPSVPAPAARSRAPPALRVVGTR